MEASRSPCSGSGSSKGSGRDGKAHCLLTAIAAAWGEEEEDGIGGAPAMTAIPVSYKASSAGQLLASCPNLCSDCPDLLGELPG